MCDQAKWAWTQIKCNLCLIFSATVWWKPPSELDLWFQRYSHFSAAENNKIQRKLNPIISYNLQIKISKFRLILLDHITYNDNTTHRTPWFSHSFSFHTLPRYLCIPSTCLDPHGPINIEYKNQNLIENTVWSEVCPMIHSYPDWQLAF